MELYRILIIEDDPAIGQSLLDGLKHHGQISVQLAPTQGIIMTLFLPSTGVGIQEITK